jgi:hypothetical protein
LAITVSSMSATLSLVTNVEVVKPKLFTKIQRSFSFISLEPIPVGRRIEVMLVQACVSDGGHHGYGQAGRWMAIAG